MISTSFTSFTFLLLKGTFSSLLKAGKEEWKILHFHYSDFPLNKIICLKIVEMDKGTPHNFLGGRLEP